MTPLFLTLTAQAGGWTQPEGAHYLKVWTRTLSGSEGFLNDGTVGMLDEGFFDAALSAYGEWGLTEEWTLLASTTPAGLSRVTDTTLYSGASLVGARRALLQDGVRLAAEVRAGGVPPVGDAVIGSGDALRIDATTGAPEEAWTWQPAVPTALAEGELQVGVGLPFGWMTAAAGGRWTSSAQLPESILGLVAVGGQAGRFGLSLTTSTVQPLSAITDANIAGTGATRYIGLEPAISVQVSERLSVVTSAGTALMAQSNAAAPALNLGIEHR